MNPNTPTTKPLVIETSRLQEGKFYQIQNFVLSSKGLFLNEIDKETNEVTAHKISEPMFIKETVQNRDTKDVHATLCYRYKGKFHEIPIRLEQLIPNELIKLSGKGVDVSHQYSKLVAIFLQEQQKLAPHREIYREVGWHEEEDGVMIFRHHYEFPHQPNILACNDSKEGSYNLEPKGSLKVWKGMVYAEVLPHLPLQTLLCIGFSAPLVGYLSKKFDDVDTLLIHLAGDSTKGKTTGALLATSIFGLPSNKKKGLMKSWNGTKNAIPNMLGGNYGIPVVLDELSMSDAKSLTSEFYVMVNGLEKYRLNDEMKQRKQASWATTIISTGEQSIFERTNQNVGLTVRAFEFSNISWTTSAENADAIRDVIQENYGHAGQAFIQFLFEQGLPIMEEVWQYWQERCITALPDSPFRTRIAKKYAIILAAGDIANEALGLMLDLESILSFLVEEEKERMMARDIGAKALNFVTQLFIQHQINFRKDGSYSNPINCWGKMFIHPDYVEVAFLKHILEQQLRQGGFDDPKVVVRNWKEKGWLVTEGDRATKRTKIFEDSEQEERRMILGTEKVPKKLQDTTYNIKLPLENLKGLIQQQEHPINADQEARNYFGL
jgi:putative DNA primase/helicase